MSTPKTRAAILRSDYYETRIRPHVLANNATLAAKAQREARMKGDLTRRRTNNHALEEIYGPPPSADELEALGAD